MRAANLTGLQAQICGLCELSGGRNSKALQVPGINSGFRSVLVATPSALLCFEGYGGMSEVLMDSFEKPSISDRVVIDLHQGVLLSTATFCTFPCQVPF